MFKIDSQSFAYDQATFCASLMECGIPDFKGKGRLPWGWKENMRHQECDAQTRTDSEEM
ncbi:hypothetical protein E5288_WYG003290 [Bos mutus]|uniref:Uncharacterized protein n=1 Tax=Bos mutus TaxID=72004 RepID=A0A6B0S6A3_9CETA|nr:hypothetical protein [Bos mutus]